MSHAIVVLGQGHISNGEISFVEQTDDYFLDEILMGYGGSIEFRLGFIDNTSPVEFDNLDFEITVSQNGNIVGQADNSGVHYETTDIEYVKAISLPVASGESFDVDVWYENAGVRVEGSYTINVPEQIVES